MTREVKVRRYRAFITYSHRDRRWAGWLHRRLEFYRVPRRLVGRETAAGTVPRRLAPIFRDREELASADDLGDSINRALENSDALIVICSPAAARSKWVNEEILRFKRNGRAARILCLIVAGEPFASEDSDTADSECFPPALRFRMDSKGNLGTEAAEPLAADLRRDGDGRTLALLKIVAGLLEVNLDELRHREQQRRNRRWAAATVLALAVTGITSFLAVEATIQRNAAERQRAQAEGLVSFMLGNLTSELQSIGRLDLLDMIGKRALSYYSSQNLDSLDADSLARRAHALVLIGQVADLRGHLNDALAAFSQAAETTSKLLARHPNDPQRIYDHAQSVYWVGYVAWQRGSMRLAETEFRLYQALAQRLVAIDPTSAAWQTELEDSWSNLGTMLLDENKVAEAADAFRKSLGISVQLAHNAPNDTDLQLDMAQSRAWLADTEIRLGRFDDAYAQRTREFWVYRQLLARNPDNSGIRESLVTSNRALARLALARGNLDDALKRIDAAVGLADGLIAQDASNTYWQELDARASMERGEILYYRGDYAGAQKGVTKALTTAGSLVALDASVVDWQTSLGQAQLLRAMLAGHRGDHEESLDIARESIARLEALPAKARKGEDIEELLLRTRLIEGNELATLGREGSIAAWQAALNVFGSDSKNLPPEARTAIAGACLRLGRAACVHAIVEELDDQYYRAPEFIALKRQMSHELTAGKIPHSATRGSGSKLQPEGYGHE